MTIEDLDLYDHYPRLRAAKARETTVPETPRAQPMTVPTETPTPGEARSVEALRAVVTTLATALTAAAGAGPASTMAYRVERRRLIDAAVSMLQVLRGQS